MPSLSSCNKKRDKLNYMQILTVEKLATKFFKYILGVHKRTTNLADYGNLGRTPFFIDIVFTIIEFFKRFEHIDNESFLGQALHIRKELHINGKESWYTSVEFITQQLKSNANSNIDEIKSKFFSEIYAIMGKNKHTKLLLLRKIVHILLL